VIRALLVLVFLASCGHRTPEEEKWSAACPPYEKYLSYRDWGLVQGGDGLNKMLRTALDPCATFKSVVAQSTGQSEEDD